MLGVEGCRAVPRSDGGGVPRMAPLVGLTAGGDGTDLRVGVRTWCGRVGGGLLMPE
jgi:hypothetical protein